MIGARRIQDLEQSDDLFTAVLDTCVLVPSLQRDFLLSLAVQGVYRPRWGEDILEELARVSIEMATTRGRISDDEAARRADHLISEMQKAFPDATISHCRELQPCGLPDPDDEHVVAAAVLGSAGVIVTHNHEDFPRGSLPDGLSLRSPARFFAEDMAAADPEGGAMAIIQMAQRMQAPPLSAADVADLLISRYGMQAAIDRIRPHLPR